MATFKLPDTKKMQEALTGVMSKVKAPENMRRYGEQAAEMIRLRTRLGSGVAASGQEKQKLKALKDSTKENRKRMKKRGELSQLTTPNRSNLTASGQMLDSVAVKNAQYGEVTIGPKGARTDGRRNEKVGQWVEKAGRPFNNLSRIENKRLTDQVLREVRDVVKSRLTRFK